MKKFYAYDIIKSLLGDIFPDGTPDHDAECLKHLQEWRYLMSAMIDDLVRVANHEDKYRESVKECSDLASDFLDLICDHLSGDVVDSKKSIVSVYPLTVCKDRYNGVYSHGKYTAWNFYPDGVPEEIAEDDISCADFWQTGIEEYKYDYGVGNTPEAAIADLKRNVARNPLFKQSAASSSKVKTVSLTIYDGEEVVKEYTSNSKKKPMKMYEVGIRTNETSSNMYSDRSVILAESEAEALAKYRREHYYPGEVIQELTDEL